MERCLGSLGDGLRVIVAGASGGIGSALARRLSLSSNVARIDALTRRDLPPDGRTVVRGQLDIEDEASIRAAAERIAQGPPTTGRAAGTDTARPRRR